MGNEIGIGLKQITSGPYAFLWAVAKDGYKLLDASTHKTVVLSLNLEEVQGIDGCPPWLVPLGDTLRQYTPLSKPTLHREFAHLYNEESIRNFASKYGLLGQYTVRLYPIGGGDENNGESLDRWQQEVRDMGVLVYIWDLVQHEATGKLGQLIKWSGSHASMKIQRQYDDVKKEWQARPWSIKDAPKPGLFSQPIYLSHLHPEPLERWQRGAIMEPAKYYICREINKRLEGHVTPQISFKDSKIHLFPDSLLSSLWVMFLMEITGNLKLRRCDVCGNWKEQKLTRDPFYCGPPCKQKAYRIRELRKVNK